MATALKFVDGSGNLRLDMNNANGWLLAQGLDVGITEVKKVYLSQMPYDGAELAASQRPIVTMTIPLILTRQSTATAMKTLFEALTVELDRDTNYIDYQPNGISAAYRFTTFRANIPSLLKGDAAVSPFKLLQSTTPVVLTIDRLPKAVYSGSEVYI